MQRQLTKRPDKCYANIYTTKACCLSMNKYGWSTIIDWIIIIKLQKKKKEKQRNKYHKINRKNKTKKLIDVISFFYLLSKSKIFRLISNGIVSIFMFTSHNYIAIFHASFHFILVVVYTP
jgi:hypothetical protein